MITPVDNSPGNGTKHFHSPFQFIAFAETRFLCIILLIAVFTERCLFSIAFEMLRWKKIIFF